MAATGTSTLLARATGGMFVVGAVASAGAATVLSSTFDWPDILREPAAVVLLAIGWSLTLSVIILRSRALPRWLGASGLVVSALYLVNQGDILATAVPGFPVWDLAGLRGSTGWGLWVAALGVTVLLRPLACATEVGSTPTATRSSSVAGLRTGTP